MSEWRTTKHIGDLKLQRNRAGLARVVDDHSIVIAPRSLGYVLAELARLKPEDGDPSRLIFVHGLLGEAEEFGALCKALKPHYGRMEHFRYPSHSHNGRHHAASLRGVLTRNPSAPIVAYSYGCRLVTEALVGSDNTGRKVVFIAPPVQPVRWAQRGLKLAPVRKFLGGSLRNLADDKMDVESLKACLLLVIEGRSSRRGDGWLRPEETQIGLPHERRVVEASHSRLLDHFKTVDAVMQFLSLP